MYGLITKCDECFANSHVIMGSFSKCWRTELPTARLYQISNLLMEQAKKGNCRENRTRIGARVRTYLGCADDDFKKSHGLNIPESVQSKGTCRKCSHLPRNVNRKEVHGKPQGWLVAISFPSPLDQSVPIGTPLAIRKSCALLRPFQRNQCILMVIQQQVHVSLW